MAMNTSITSSQRKRYLRFVENAAERALGEIGLDKDSLQRLIEHGDDLQSAIVAKIRELSVLNQYADEEVSSNTDYPKEYQVRPIAQQIDELRKHFPPLSLGLTSEFIEKTLPGLVLPSGAEGWFAIPRFDKVAGSYHEAVELVLKAIASARPFYNYRERRLGPEYLSQHKRTIKMFRELSAQQKGDLLIVPAQFGKRHAGRSVRQAREVFMASEFGLGAFAVGCMLLANPERLQAYDDLWIDCPGDEYALGTDGRFGGAPCFYFVDSKVRFGAHGFGHPDSRDGSASAFLPQPG